MKTLAQIAATSALILASMTWPAGAEPADTVKPALPAVAHSFGPQDVRLLDGPFRHAMELDAKWLLSLEPDRLLSWYRKEAGLQPMATNYGGWEAQGVAGHSLDHHLSACARMYHAAGDARFRERVTYIVDELAECQRANGNGFVGAMPNGKRVFAEVAAGNIRSAGFDLNGSWVPWYTLHKLLAGLIDARRLCDSTNALEIAVKLSHWADETTRNLTSDQWQRMLACEHGGMNESLADLYALTGDQRHLDIAKKFYHRAVLDPLAAGRDELPGKHANTQIPKMIGAARIHELTGDPKFGAISRNFFHIVLTNHTYVTGGNSEGEHFGPSGKLNNRLGVNTTETCNTYNMLKLARALFEQEPAAVYADYSERALFNHILASQHPEDGRVLYFLTLHPGEHKHFLDPLAFTCCSGTGMENHARYNEAIYFHGDDALWVNQFIASELTWAQKGLRVRQETEFPKAGRTRLTISAQKPTKLKLFVRQPAWATAGFVLKVNGKREPVPDRPSSYAAIDRVWADGDSVEVEMPFLLRTEAMPDNPNRIAVFSGPLLLAGDVDAIGSTTPVPVLVTDNRPVSDWVKPVANDPLRFRTQGVGRPGDVELKPFFAIHDRRHSVYWDVFTEAAWKVRENEYKAEQERIAELELRTVDHFGIGEMQPERDHQVKGEKTGAAEFNGRKLRHAWDGGWFSFQVAVPTNAPADLVITYWGSETGRRTFDVLLDGERLATTSLHQDKPDQFWDKTYALPAELTRGKSNVVVKFQAHPGNFAGGVFGVRVVATGGPRPQPTLKIDASKPTAKVSPLHYGLMTEEINYSYDGGLYAELVRNRAFLDDSSKAVHWSAVTAAGSIATIALDRAQPLNGTIPASLRVDVTSASSGARAGVANAGYWGIPVKPATRYRASFHACGKAGFNGPLRVAIVSNDGETVYAQGTVAKLTPDWHVYDLTFVTAENVAATTHARLEFTTETPGTFWLGFASLFPPTWNDRPNGLRRDIMQMLVDLKPAFLRFPGGNYLEGDTVENRFDWKRTLGPVTERPGHQGPWGYRSTDGMGLLEFLLWCEDMGAEPVLAVYAGYSFKVPVIKPGPALEPFVQEALEEIEYVMGPATSKWGARRAADGHPKPFTLHYVEIGNEDFFDKPGDYDGRFAQFFDAIKKQHPQLKCISTIGNEQPKDKRLRTRVPDVLDEHYYRQADDFLRNSPTHFDHYDRNGPEIFVGEWAAYETPFVPWDKRSKGEPPTPNMKAALADAAWMTAMEKHSDLIKMQCYAPMFVNVNEYQWRPNLIGYDGLTSFGSPSYHAIGMFSRNVGNEILQATLEDAAGLHATVTEDSSKGTIYVKLVNGIGAERALRIVVEGGRELAGTAEVETLAADPKETNSMKDPRRVVPVTGTVNGVKSAFTFKVAAYSVTVLRLRR